MSAIALSDVDVTILDHDQLDAFIEILGRRSNHEGLTIITDDGTTRGTIEFNLIARCGDEHGIATQLHAPTTPDDTILDLRHEAPADFSEYLLGLA